MKVNLYRQVAIRILQAALVFGLAGSTWIIYKRLPVGPEQDSNKSAPATIQIVMEQPPESAGLAMNVTIDFYPVDIVAVRHEFFTEPRAGKRFDDFLKERMKGRSPVTTRLDQQGKGSVTLAPGNWWLHAKLSGDEELEWRLPVSVIGGKQTLQLNAQNAYTRSKTF